MVIALAVVFAAAIAAFVLERRSNKQDRDEVRAVRQLYTEQLSLTVDYQRDRDAWKVKHDEAQHAADEALQALALARTNRNEAMREATDAVVEKIRKLGIADAAVILDGLLAAPLPAAGDPGRPAAGDDRGTADAVSATGVASPDEPGRSS